MYIKNKETGEEYQIFGTVREGNDILFVIYRQNSFSGNFEFEMVYAADYEPVK